MMQVSYKSPEELWKSVKGQEKNSWYKPAVEYWDQQPASYDGVLAGMPCCRCNVCSCKIDCKTAVLISQRHDTCFAHSTCTILCKPSRCH